MTEDPDARPDRPADVPPTGPVGPPPPGAGPGPGPGGPGGTPPPYAGPPYAGPPYAGPPYAAQPGPFSPLVGRPLASEETTWSMLAHLGAIVLGFIAPLIVLLVEGQKSPYTRHHAVESLNFQITITIAYVISAILIVVVIGFLLLAILGVADLILCILAALAANRGEIYRYPMTLRLVK